VDRDDIQPEEESTANISLASLLQENSEFIGQDLLRNILGLRFFNRAGHSSTEKGLTELTSDIETNDQLENGEMDDLSPAKVVDDSKYTSGSYEPDDSIGSVDEIARDPADYFEKIPKLHSKGKAGKKSGKLNSSSRKKLKSSSKIHSEPKAVNEKKTDKTGTSLDDGHVLMVLDAANNNTQLDPLYLVIQSKDGNLTSVLNSKIFNTRAKLYDIINKIGCNNNTTIEPSTNLMDREGCGVTRTTEIPIKTFETITQEITEKTKTTSKSCKIPIKHDQGLNSTSIEHPPVKNKQPSETNCGDESIDLKPMFLKVYVPLSVQL
ncbi:hypothetical protein LSTR_LSTR017058, partial [Laodelphax striatellus]